MRTQAVSDLYGELALHRVGQAIETLACTPAPRLAARSAWALEQAAAALACFTAAYSPSGGRLPELWQAEIDDLVAAAASLEQLADFCHHQSPTNGMEGGDDDNDD